LPLRNGTQAPHLRTSETARKIIKMEMRDVDRSGRGKPNGSGEVPGFGHYTATD